MIQLFRWLAIIPACIAAWWLALFIGLYVRSVVNGLCPPESLAYGFLCEASWYPAAAEAVLCFGVALSAILVVLTAAAVAPRHRVLTAKAALIVGTLVAIYFAIGTGAYLALGAAVLAGTFALVVVTHISEHWRLATRHVA